MAYTKTNWQIGTERSLANLNNIETQYDEAVAEGLNIRKDDTKELRVEVAVAAPASPATGRIYFNSGDKTTYYYNGNRWVALPLMRSVYNVDNREYVSLSNLIWPANSINFSDVAWTKKVGYGPLIAPGEYTTSFHMKANTSGTAYGRLYKNGVALGDIVSAGTSGVGKTETFTYEVGDTIEFWAYYNGANSGSISYCEVESSLQAATTLIAG